VGSKHLHQRRWHETNSLGSMDRISRRDFLKILRIKNHGILLVDKEQCTGCGLCAIDCPTKALAIRRTMKQILFSSCSGKRPVMLAVLWKILPGALPSIRRKRAWKGSDRKGSEDYFWRWNFQVYGMWYSLFPQSMGKKLKAKIFIAKEPPGRLTSAPPAEWKPNLKRKRKKCWHKNNFILRNSIWKAP